MEVTVILIETTATILTPTGGTQILTEKTTTYMETEGVMRMGLAVAIHVLITNCSHHYYSN